MAATYLNLFLANSEYLKKVSKVILLLLFFGYKTEQIAH